MKVTILNKDLRKSYSGALSVVSTVCSLILIFVEIPKELKITIGSIFLTILIIGYLGTWIYSNFIKRINITIANSPVTIKEGDLFAQKGFKAISFNEYFDTQVNERILSSNSLNGIYIKEHNKLSTTDLDAHIEQFPYEIEDKLELNQARREGKLQRFKIGTICVLDDYLLTAFSKFDEYNRAVLTMPEYLDFLITFWDRVNRVYSQKSVSVPIFGSGITRIKEHKNIEDEDLLRIMLWTFRISEMRFKHPAQLTIVIHSEKIGRVNLFEIRSIFDEAESVRYFV